MPKNLTNSDRKYAQEQLERCQELQASFWMELDDLSIFLGKTIDPALDLEDRTLDDLLSEPEDPDVDQKTKR